MEQTKFDGITISSGEKDYYFLDDQQIPFRPNPHFLQWVPLFSENHLLTVSPGQSVLLRIFQPSSYWNDPISLPDLPESERVEIKFFDDLEELWSDVKESKNHAFIGPASRQAGLRQFKINPEDVISALNWQRGEKTPYEVACLQTANRCLGTAKPVAFANHGSELEVHLQYLRATQQTEHQTPYQNIIAFDRNSAVLHYASKNLTTNHRVCLIDAGYQYRGYCSDISRTFARNDAHPLFANLIGEMELAQQSSDSRGWHQPSGSSRGVFTLSYVDIDEIRDPEI